MTEAELEEQLSEARALVLENAISYAVAILERSDTEAVRMDHLLSSARWFADCERDLSRMLK